MITHLQNLDYVAILIYVFLMAVIGLSLGWFVKDIGSYFKGNGAIPWFMATISNFMALFSTFVFVAYAGVAYEHGLVSITVFWATVPACIIGGVLLAKRWRRTGHTTPMEYLEQRYTLGVRQTITWVGLLMRFLDNMVRLYAVGVFITVVTPLSLEWSIVISGIIVTVFNIVGGLWSVVIMSTVQFFILILIVLILLSLSINKIGGFNELYEKIPAHMTWFNGPKGSILWLGVYYLMIIFKYNGNWTFIQKFNSVKDEKAAMKVGIITGILFLIFTPIFLLPAVIAPILIPDLADPEMSYVLVSKLLLPTGVMGILFASMFAATMSSLNSEYNIMSGVLTNDVYKRLIKPKAGEKTLLTVARVSTGLVGAIMILGGLYIKNFSGAFEANKLFTGIFAIPMGFPLLFGVLFKKPNTLSAVLTIFIGAFTGIVLNAIPSVSWEWATLIETLICALIYFVPGYLIRAKDETNLKVQSFFAIMETPIKESEKPAISLEYKKSMTVLFIFSLIIAGIMFISMSLISIQTMGGKLGFCAGMISLIIALLLFIKLRKYRMQM